MTTTQRTRAYKNRSLSSARIYQVCTVVEDVAAHQVVVSVAAEEVSEDVVAEEASVGAMDHHEVEADRKHSSIQIYHIC